MLRLTLLQKKRLSAFALNTKADEFRWVMDAHGMYVAPYPQRGSHTCSFWCNEKTANKLREMSNTQPTMGLKIEGITCNFRVCEYTHMWGGKSWMVSYEKK